MIGSRKIITIAVIAQVMLGFVSRVGAQGPRPSHVPRPQAVATDGPSRANPRPQIRHLPPVGIADLRFRAIRRPVQNPASQGENARSPGDVAGVRPPPVVVADERLGSPVKIPADFEPWWQAAALRPLRESPQRITIDVNSLIVDALRYSAQVRAISDNAIIAETAITRAAAEFDVHGFMESKMVSTSVPTGSELEAGPTAVRLREEDWFYRAGLRKKNGYGGRLEAAQQIGSKDSSSEFFSPLNQGNSRLTLSYNQPLLNGAGEAYNSSLILLADVDTRVAEDRTTTQLQDQLLEVTESMWELYVQRSLLLQKHRHLERAIMIHKRLEKRRDVDSLDSQIARANAAVATRRTELIRARTAIRNAESFLRALVNSPAMLADRTSELVPAQTPLSYFVPVNLEDALATALHNRPDIDAAAQEIEAARIRLDMARNELLPV
ncbi:MAG: TolC family protein, partial [Pirellulaceae bacterium]|nr:TolC family protein [Pirellulaceae bacterium]